MTKLAAHCENSCHTFQLPPRLPTHTLMSAQKLQNQKPKVLTVHWEHSGKTLSAG